MMPYASSQIFRNVPRVRPCPAAHPVSCRLFRQLIASTEDIGISPGGSGGSSTGKTFAGDPRCVPGAAVRPRTSRNRELSIAMLTEQEVEQYHREGYTVHPGFYSREEVAALLAEIDGSAGNTLAAHEKTRLELESSQPPQGTQVRRIFAPCT